MFVVHRPETDGKGGWDIGERDIRQISLKETLESKKQRRCNIEMLKGEVEEKVVEEEKGEGKKGNKRVEEREMNEIRIKSAATENLLFDQFTEIAVK